MHYSDAPQAAMQKLSNINAAGQLGAAYVPPTLSQRLHEQRSNLETQLANVNEAIAKLEANPVIEEVLNFVSKVGMY